MGTNQKSNIKAVQIMLGNGNHNGITQGSIDYLKGQKGASNFVYTGHGSEQGGPFELFISGDGPEYLAFSIMDTSKPADEKPVATFFLKVDDLCRELDPQNPSPNTFVEASYILSENLAPSASERLAHNDRHARLIDLVKRQLAQHGLEISPAANPTYAIDRIVVMMREEIAPTDRYSGIVRILPGLARPYGPDSGPP